jgi:hypothetical protein
VSRGKHRDESNWTPALSTTARFLKFDGCDISNTSPALQEAELFLDDRAWIDHFVMAITSLEAIIRHTIRDQTA